MIVEVLFWGVVVGAVLFAVAAADMIGQVFIGFSVNVPCELPYCATGWTSVAGRWGFVGLESVHGALGIK